jgi:uncharacterized protein (DUF1800 family)
MGVMSRRVAVALLPFVLAAGLSAAKKPAKKPAVSAAPQMTGDQRVLHALNRLTFGPRPGDMDAVRNEGLEEWIEAQLHPESIPLNPGLAAKLEPLDSMRMSSSELVRTYPTPQMVQAMMDGRMELPEDPTARVAAKVMMERLKKRKGQPEPPPDSGSEEQDAKAAVAGMPISDQQKEVLLSGAPQAKLALLESLPIEKLMNVMADVPLGMRGRIAGAASPELRRRIEILTAPGQVVNRDLMESKLYRAIYSDQQLEEVLTDFWFNHFNVFLDKGADRMLVTAYERDVIRPRVLGKFRDLLVATAESPAMLFYLDNWESVGPDARVNRNRKQRMGLNENYGRELMELHTLGVDGGYTQKDVTEVARCFTGWTILQPLRGGGFEFNERMHDEGEKHVLGVTIAAGGGMEDGLRVLDILARHPATARFISRKLAMRFVSDDPPESLVTKMAQTFTSTDGDIREVMRTMLSAPEFWDPANFRSKVKSPFEMVVSAVRATGADVRSAMPLANQLTTLGEPLYRKMEPTGYSNRGAEWLNSASLLARMNFGATLAAGRIQGVVVDQSKFAAEPGAVERSLLQTDASPEARAAIDAGLAEQKQLKPERVAQLVAGLTLGSPDFQKR